MIDRHLQPYNRLQYKLTLSYAVVTVLVTLAIETCLLAVVEMGVIANLQHTLPAQLEALAPGLASYFRPDGPDRMRLQTWLEVLQQQQEAGQGSTAAGKPGEVLQQVLGSDGRPLASAGEVELASDSASDRQVIAAALAGNPSGTRLRLDPRRWSASGAAPVRGAAGEILGVLFVKAVYEDNRLQIANIEPLLLPGVLFVALVAGLAAVLSGYLNARSLTRRLGKLAERATEWSQGEFVVRINDRSRDELGDLARQFDRMAGQIDSLLSARQELAALEERNRLARDLHDSVKQQVFALAMLLSAGRTLSASRPDLGQARLAEAEKLTHQVQQELELLIQQLRPGASAPRELTMALREYIADWSHQCGVAVDVRIDEALVLPDATQQALLRVAQEALANTARHANAARVRVFLACLDRAVILKIEDDGAGFDVAGQTGRGLGLVTMRERMEALDGRLEIQSAPGVGTQITARCQIPGVADGRDGQ